MITAIDTSVLFDIFLPDPKYLDRSREAIRESFRSGGLVICEPVYAELASQFSQQSELDGVLSFNEIDVEPVTREAAYDAGHCFRSYRRAGRKRERIITDFLIGCHANRRADRFLSRDRGFYRRYFKNLRLIDPTES